jgi:hypothetical protein
MRRRVRRLAITICIAVCTSTGALGQKTLTWEEAKRKRPAVQLWQRSDSVRCLRPFQFGSGAAAREASAFRLRTSRSNSLA